MRYIKLWLFIIAATCLQYTQAQNKIMKGKVLDEKGASIMGASVKAVGSTKGAITNSDGTFELSIPIQTSSLNVSRIGFETNKIKINKIDTFIIIKMLADKAELNEVVVSTGITNYKSKHFTGSTSKITEKTIYNNSINYSLQGRVPGLMILKDKTKTEEQWQDNEQVNYNTEGYDNIQENPFLNSKQNPLSTFSIDVDNASYSNVRRIINSGNLPPAGAIRIEEMINYFKYNYPQPQGNIPFTINTEFSDCPWNFNHKLLLVGLQAKTIDESKLPPSSLTFLIDVSGSMSDDNKLPLLVKSLELLVDKLRDEDKVAIVVYAGNSGLVLPSTNNKKEIKKALNKLHAGGSTAGGEGIKLAYKTAKDNFLKNGNNRVILCTDGDFNVGVTSDDELVRLIEEERESGVFLSVLGFGMGNYQDAKMQKLADKGNGNHSYIDDLSEAKKVLINEFGGTLFTVAKDVKFQIEFNPLLVKEYRLIGYENRVLNKEDFNDDKKDAGDLGSGHNVTALYEIIPNNLLEEQTYAVDDLHFQNQSTLKNGIDKTELMIMKLRFKNPSDSLSRLVTATVKNELQPLQNTSSNFRQAAAVAEFGLVLRKSNYRSNANYEQVKELFQPVLLENKDQYKKEFLMLVDKANELEKIVKR